MKNIRISWKQAGLLAALAAAIAFCCLILTAERKEPIVLPDSLDYKIQADTTLFSKEFFYPAKRKWFSPRPFTVPLMYKMVDSDPKKVVSMQKVFYCFSVILLVMAIIRHLRSGIVKFFTAVCLLFFFTWWNIVGWTDVMLSESFSMSFLLVWIACLLFYFKNPRWPMLAVLAIVSVLFSFSRDSWPYVICAVFGANIFFWKLNDRNMLVKNVILAVFAFIIFLLQSYAAKTGEHYKMPVYNSIAGRITKVPAYMDWFKKTGMPLTEKMTETFKGVDIDSDEGRKLIYKTYEDSGYAPVFAWILKDGKNTYQKFMLSHPSYPFLSDKSPGQKDVFFCANLNRYTHKAQGFLSNAGNVFPLFSLPVCIILSLACLVLFFCDKARKILLLPLSLWIMMFVNAMVSFNADGLEVERHVFMTQIFLNFTCIVCLALTTDFVIFRRRQSQGNKLPDF